jgi:hypothetical protein
MLYGYDPNAAQLIKTRASLDYAQTMSAIQNKKKTFWKTELAIAAVAVILILCLVLSMRFMDRMIGAVPTPPSAAPSEIYKPPSSIQEAVTTARSNVRDVNFDDKRNCIDFAVVFYEIWPNSKIIRVWNDAGFNHLLNQVDDKYIEPQALYGDPHSMWPEFDTMYKKDETYVWGWWASYKKWW